MPDIKKAFGKKLKEIRKGRKYTQQQFAEKLDLSSRQLIRIENGQNFPSADTLEKIIHVLNIKIKDLFNFDLDE